MIISKLFNITMKKKKINCMTLFSLFLDWTRENNWIREEQEVFYLTPEGEEEMEALGLDIPKLLNNKVKKKEKTVEQAVKEEIRNNKKKIHKIHLYTDGGSRGNQFAEGGKAAIGIVVCDDHDEIITCHKQYLGRATNNQAEYQALITALSLIQNYHPKEVTCFSDSQLMIKQMNGVYRIKDKKLQKLAIQVKELEGSFDTVMYVHLKRENRLIKRADRLVNQVMDAQGV